MPPETSCGEEGLPNMSGDVSNNYRVLKRGTDWIISVGDAPVLRCADPNLALETIELAKKIENVGAKALTMSPNFALFRSLRL